MNTVIKKIYALEQIRVATGTLLIGLLCMACSGQSDSSSTDQTDSLQPTDGSGVPLNNLERSNDTDTVDQQIDSNSGVPLDNLNRDNSDDTVNQPAMPPTL